MIGWSAWMAVGVGVCPMIGWSAWLADGVGVSDDRMVGLDG